MSLKNTFCWVDIPVLNIDRAIIFYSGLLKQKIEKISEHEFEFGLLPHEENNVSGCLVVMKDRKPSTDGPLIYLNLEGELDRAIQSIEELGGKIIQQKMQIGPYGHRAIILDSEGNAIALYSKE